MAHVKKGALVRLTDDLDVLKARLGGSYVADMERYLGEQGRVTFVTAKDPKNGRTFAQGESLGPHWYEVSALHLVKDEAEDRNNAAEGGTEEAQEKRLRRMLELLANRSGEERQRESTPSSRASAKRASHHAKRDEKRAPGELRVGDFVRLDVDRDELERLAQGHGGFVESMALFCGKQGYVASVRKSGKTCKVMGMGPFVYNFKCFKVLRGVELLIRVNHVVELTRSRDRLEELNPEYKPAMDAFLGRRSIVSKVDLFNQRAMVRGFGSFWYSFDVLTTMGPLRCPRNGAKLAFSRAPHAHYLCDVCRADISLNEPVMACRPCNFDMCARCTFSAMLGMTPLEGQAHNGASSRHPEGAAAAEKPSGRRVSLARSLRRLTGDRGDLASAHDAGSAASRRSERQRRAATRHCVLSYHPTPESTEYAQVAKLIEENGGGRVKVHAIAGKSDQTHPKEALKKASCLVVLLSRSYLKSLFCLGHIAIAHKAGIPILGVVVDNSELRDWPEVRTIASLARDSELLQSGWERRMDRLQLSNDVLAGLQEAGKSLSKVGPIEGSEFRPQRVNHQASNLARKALELGKAHSEDALRYWEPAAVAQVSDLALPELGEAQDSLQDKGLSVFLSHDWGPEPEFAHHKHALLLCNALEELGVKVWIDSKYLVPGDRLRNKILRAMDECTLFVVCLTPNYITKCETGEINSDYCCMEAEWAWNNRINRVIPVRMDSEVNDSSIGARSTLSMLVKGRVYISCTSTEDQVVRNAAVLIRDKLAAFGDSELS